MALLVLIPGWLTTRRVSEIAIFSVVPDLIERLEMEGKFPRCVMVITISEFCSQF